MTHDLHLAMISFAPSGGSGGGAGSLTARAMGYDFSPASRAGGSRSAPTTGSELGDPAPCWVNHLTPSIPHGRPRGPHSVDRGGPKRTQKFQMMKCPPVGI